MRYTITLATRIGGEIRTTRVVVIVFVEVQARCDIRNLCLSTLVQNRISSVKHNIAGLGSASVTERSTAGGNLQRVQAGVRVPGTQQLFLFLSIGGFISPTLQVPQFNNQANVQFVSSDCATLLHNWVTEALHPRSTFSKHEFLVGLVDGTVDTHIRELLPSNTRTLVLYTAVKNLKRQNWLSGPFV